MRKLILVPPVIAIAALGALAGAQSKPNSYPATRLERRALESITEHQRRVEVECQELAADKAELTSSVWGSRKIELPPGAITDFDLTATKEAPFGSFSWRLPPQEPPAPVKSAS